MENFAYPIKLEPLSRPARQRTKSQRRVTPAQPLDDRTRRHLELRAERERNGVSLKAIADNTRIPLRHLEELERGDIDNWPAGVYAKSWARDYAKEAGIDPDRVVAMVAPVAEVEPTIEEIREVRDEVERKRVDESPLAGLVDLARKFAAVIVVLLLMVIAAIYFTRGDSGAEATSAPAPVGTTGVAPGPPR